MRACTLSSADVNGAWCLVSNLRGKACPPTRRTGAIVRHGHSSMSSLAPQSADNEVARTYRGHLLEWVMLHCRFVLQPVLRSEGQKGFVVLPRRWVVERTFAWLTQCRRLGKDYEVLPASSEAMIYIAMTRLMVRRLAAS